MLIKNGKLIDPKSNIEEVVDIVIDEDRVKYIGKVNNEKEYDLIIDATDKVVAPGLIDVHVHFRDPGLTYKEDLFTGSAAAAKGGFTTVVCMANTNPVIDNEETLREFLEKAKKCPVNVKTVATISKGLKGKELVDMGKLLKLGVVGFSDDGIPIMNAGFLHKAMVKAKELDVVLSLHEEDPSLIGYPGVNEGEASKELGIKGASRVSESSMVARDSMLALDTGAKVHMQHLSSKEAVEVVRFAKKIGANVTGEVTPQHFSLTDKEVIKKGTVAKLNPPLRTAEDIEEIIKGLKDKTIDMIVTDHAPHSEEEKAKDITKAPSGLIGLETSLAVGIKYLVEKGHLTLMELIEKMTINPAKLYKLDSGYLKEGSKADIVIFDDKEQWIVKEFASKSSNSPYIGEKLTGKIKYTICNGKIVYKDEK
ncbi:dihydroorotase [Miniphocaeibacter halophilus]|uniref:dihydroorotase n=1 Tax=Miniphocaeibacter halophilus TaxID=2931922 RepID=UPI001FB51010|nr:dihydroorotase [Miniphocaeibacter halophilus]